MRKRLEKIDYSAEMNKHDSPAVRLLFVALALFGLLLATYLYRIPSRDRPR